VTGECGDVNLQKMKNHSPLWRAKRDAERDESMRLLQQAIAEWDGKLTVLPSSHETAEMQRKRELLAPYGRARRHALRLRVDGLRPNGTFDDFVMVKTLRAFEFLPSDLGIARDSTSFQVDDVHEDAAWQRHGSSEEED
jgi:hypothetical protein